MIKAKGDTTASYCLKVHKFTIQIGHQFLLVYFWSVHLNNKNAFQ